MLLDAHVDKGAGGGQCGFHLSEAVLHSLEEFIKELKIFFTGAGGRRFDRYKGYSFTELLIPFN